MIHIACCLTYSADAVEFHADIHNMFCSALAGQDGGASCSLCLVFVAVNACLQHSHQIWYMPEVFRPKLSML